MGRIETMSFDINWNKLIEDNDISDSIKDFLDEQFKKIELPSYIADLSVTDFSLGDTPPEIIIRHIGDPFESFYEEDDDYSATKSPMHKYELNQGDQEREEDDDVSSISDDVTNHGIKMKNTNNTTIINDSIPLRLSTPPILNRSQTSSDSIQLIIGGNNQLNYMQNYNMNNIVGFVKQDNQLNSKSNSSSNLTGRETPIDILKANHEYKFQINKRKSTTRSENDIQLISEINYFGNLQMEITAKLLVNYPSPNFISLPVKLHVTDLVIHLIAAIAYLKNSVFFSFLCDINDSNSEYFSNPESTHGLSSGGNFVEYVNGPNHNERIDIIKKVKIESEIGEVENNVLRNVGKVERFLTDQLRRILRDEIAWPSWVCFDLNDDDSESDHED